jgi:hypothetical protein
MCGPGHVGGGFPVLYIYKRFDFVRHEVKSALNLASLKPITCMLGWHYSPLSDPLSYCISGIYFE